MMTLHVIQLLFRLKGSSSAATAHFKRAAKQWLQLPLNTGEFLTFYSDDQSHSYTAVKQIHRVNGELRNPVETNCNY